MKKTIDKALACIEIQEKLGFGNLKVLEIADVKHNPHPYLIGANHISWANQHFGGMLNEACLKDFEANGGLCSHPKCRVKYEEHTHERALLVVKEKEFTKEQAALLLPKIKPLLLKYEIDGIAFGEPQHKRV